MIEGYKAITISTIVDIDETNLLTYGLQSHNNFYYCRFYRNEGKS